jgi:hypothetical protein
VSEQELIIPLNHVRKLRLTTEMPPKIDDDVIMIVNTTDQIRRKYRGVFRFRRYKRMVRELAEFKRAQRTRERLTR